MRRDLVRAGVVLIAAGIAVVAVAGVFLGAAIRDFFGCFGGSVPDPGTFPVACADAAARMTSWQVVQGIGYAIAAVGVVLLIAGVLLNGTPRPAYPPPAYGWAYAPPPAPPPGPPSPPPSAPDPRDPA